MRYVFIVSWGSPETAKPRPIIHSARTTNPVRAFAIARRFPSAVAVWNAESGEPVAATTINDLKSLNAFFDTIRECEI